MSSKPFLAQSTQVKLAFYFVLGGVLLIMTRHGDAALWLNARHSPSGDIFFKYWTYLGDGLLLGIVALWMLLTHYYRFFLLMMGVLLQTIFVHLFKQWLYAGEPRPKTFFANEIEQLNFVEGVTVRGYDSFPSGHTASAFVLAIFLIHLTKNEKLRSLLLTAALLVGISRIYLLQHFLRDVYVGSLFGVLAMYLAWLIIRKYEDRSKLQRGLLIKR